MLFFPGAKVRRYFQTGEKIKLRVYDDDVTTVLLILQKHYGCYKCVM